MTLPTSDIVGHVLVVVFELRQSPKQRLVQMWQGSQGYAVSWACEPAAGLLSGITARRLVVSRKTHDQPNHIATTGPRLYIGQTHGSHIQASDFAQVRGSFASHLLEANTDERVIQVLQFRTMIAMTGT